MATALRTLDFAALSKLASATAGVTISPHAFVSTDAQVVNRDRIAHATTDTTVRLWGFTDGEGAPIRQTLQQRLTAISGSTALTSTSMIGYDVVVHTSNSANNIATRFAGAHVVEYHFAGTSRHRDFDWTSVRLVFDTSGSMPLLIAIVEDTWTI